MDSGAGALRGGAGSLSFAALCITERWPSGRRRTPAKGVRVKSPSRVRIPLSPPVESSDNAPVAQLDRVSGYEPEGREFESLRARHEMEKGSHENGAPFSFHGHGAAGEGLRTPDVVGRSTTSRPRGWTLPIRGEGAHRQRPQRGGQVAERGRHLSGRASETDKGPSQGALFRFTGFTCSSRVPAQRRPKAGNRASARFAVAVSQQRPLPAMNGRPSLRCRATGRK